VADHRLLSQLATEFSLHEGSNGRCGCFTSSARHFFEAVEFELVNRSLAAVGR
jgi:hypothetical protein